MSVPRPLWLVLWLATGLANIPLASAQVLVERPVPEDGGPTKVFCAIGVLDLDEISDASQNFTANVFVRLSWSDPSQAHEQRGAITKPVEEVWHPHLIFLNKQRIQSSLTADVQISPDGTVTYRQQFWGDFSQPMNLHDFPFDTQTLELRLVAAGPEEFGELDLQPDPEVASFIVENYSVADWTVIHSEVSLDSYVLPGGEQTEAFAFTFTAKRRSSHFLIRVIAPLVMIVLLSAVVFWLDPKDGASQLGVSVTAFLTVIAYHIMLSSKLPEISYLTRFDIFVFGATLLVFLAMIEVVITTCLANMGRIDTARRTGRALRVAFPGALALVSVYALFLH